VRLRLLFAAALAAFLLAPAAAAAPFSSIRIAAYYPWFPEGWTHAQTDPFTHYRPSLGFYDAGRPAVIERHIRAMKWGHITAATYSWWGRGSQTDGRFAAHLSAGAKLGFQWAIYHELEGYGDPSVESIRADLEYIRDTYAASPGYLKLGGRPVVFVYGDQDDGKNCGSATRWATANETVGAYLVLRTFKGYRACEASIDGWHPYSANKNEFDLFPFAYSISPGFYFAIDNRPARRRSVRSWSRMVHRMVDSPAQFHFVISFNEWGEGTAIESAVQWASPSGYGRYLDVLHAVPPH
jgi:glycosyl hydrolase family 99